MAKIIYSRSIGTVQKDYNLYKKNIAKKYIARGACTGVCFFMSYKLAQTGEIWYMAAIFALIVVFFSTLHNYTYNGLRALKSGLEGEKSTVRILKKLPKEYIILPDLRFKNIQIDCIVLSPGCAFVIETKNHAGQICILDDVTCASQLKITKRGVRHINPIANPISQALKGADSLKGILPKGFKIKPLVYFSKKGTCVKNMAGFPIFSYNYKYKMIEYIVKNGRGKLNRKQLLDIAYIIAHAE